MTSNHWIITNRPVIPKDNGSGEYVEEYRGLIHPMPEFRIAQFTPPAKSKRRIKDEAYQAAVQFTPDEYVGNYDDLLPDGDPWGERGTRQLFLALYQSMLSAPPGKRDVLFFMHGFNYSWLDALRHLHKLHELYVLPHDSPIHQIVYFTWPSMGHLAPHSYKQDEEGASLSGEMIGRLFRKIRQFYAEFFQARENGERPAFCRARIHMAAHSLGNRVMENFLKVVNSDIDRPINLFEEILLLNADVDWNALEPGRALHRLPDYGTRIHVYKHPNDDALHFSETTMGNTKRLGRHGPRPGPLNPEFVTVDCNLDPSDLQDEMNLKGDPFADCIPGMHGLGSTSSTRLKEVLFDHWGYLYRSTVIQDIKAVLRGEATGAIPNRLALDTQHYRLTLA